MFKIFDHIYVINLESSIERKNHIVKELERVGIEKYEIFNATDKDSDEVLKLMESHFVMKFPPCFRCRKNECNCNNNVLIKQQIGIWCSLMNIWKDIIKNGYQNSLICEDDIKFTDNHRHVFDILLNENTFKKYNIDSTRPLLIRVGSGYSNLHEDKRDPFFTNDIIMSGPCFAVNIEMAKILLDNLEKIVTTPDIYVHRDILKVDENIQHFTMIPQPVYELSTGKFAKFYSEIHPKLIDDIDIERDKSHIKRIEYKKILCIGHPRCGTGYTANFLNKLGLNVGHENMMSDGVSSWMLAANDENYPWGDIKNKDRYYFANTIHVIRNPFEAIPAIILENRYTPDNKSYKFRKKHIENYFDIELLSFEDDFKTQLEMAVQTFIYWNKMVENQKPDFVFRIEYDHENLISYLTNTKLVVNSKMPDNVHEKINSNKLYQGKKHEKPIVSTNDYLQLSPDLLNELILFCEKYGYEHFLYSSNITTL